MPVEGDKEISSDKRDKLLQNLSEHLPNAVSVLYWKEEQKEHSACDINTPSEESINISRFIDLYGLVRTKVSGMTTYHSRKNVKNQE